MIESLLVCVYVFDRERGFWLTQLFFFVEGLEHILTHLNKKHSSTEQT